jgi:hypothetical protein
LLGGHRVPTEVANDPLFRLLAEAYEGRSRAAVRSDQKSSSNRNRQQFLNLIKRRVPKSDILSLVATVGAAILHYDKISGMQEGDFIFLAKLLRFLDEFGIIKERFIAPVADELKAKISCKTETFDKYLFEWDRQTQKEALEREKIKAVELAEKMHASKKKALERQAARRNEQQNQEQGAEQSPLGPELQNREPVVEDLRKHCPEERSLVHSLRTAELAHVN